MMEKKFSSQIMQLRFMQRAVEKSQEPSPEQRSQIQERWVVEGARDRCIVLMEGDPAMPCEGRLTFSSGRNENDDGAVEIGNPDHQTLENKESEAVKGTNDPQNQSKPSLGNRNLERYNWCHCINYCTHTPPE